MKNYKKFNIQIRAGKHLISEWDTPLKAALELKRLCPNLGSRSILKRVYQHIGKGVTKVQGELRDTNSKIGGRFHLKLVLRENILKKMKELDLVKLYNNESIKISFKDRIFSEMFERYKHFLINEANRMHNKIPLDYFAMDFEDCHSESLHCLKLAIEYFDETKVGENFDPEKFSIAYYVSRQMDARISSYYYKFYKKQKKQIQYDSYDIQLSTEDGQNHSNKFKDSRNLEESVNSKIIMDELDLRLCPIQRKIKNFLMDGIKESKIKSQLKLTEKIYQDYKNKLKSNLIAIGFTE